MSQIVCRLDADLLAAIDDLIERGVVESRSAAVRAGLRAIVEAHRRAATGRAIAEGYERIPPDAELEPLAMRAGLAMIEAEPW